MTEFPYLLPFEESKRASSQSSVFERMLDLFSRHQEHEREVLTEYSKIAEQTHHEPVKFLLQMILMDEDRHHTLMRLMANTMRDALEWRRTGEGIEFGGELGLTKEELLAITRKFIQIERGRIREDQQLL